MDMTRYKMTLGEAMRVVELIVASGKDAEIRRATDGMYIVYAIDKTRMKKGDIPEHKD